MFTVSGRRLACSLVTAKLKAKPEVRVDGKFEIRNPKWTVIGE